MLSHHVIVTCTLYSYDVLFTVYTKLTHNAQRIEFRVSTVVLRIQYIHTVFTKLIFLITLLCLTGISLFF